MSVLVKYGQLNDFLYSIVNQFSLDEFEKYTNFREIVKTIFQGTQLDSCIARNLRINVPNEGVWRAGGFSSLKLAGDFYESEAAVRIFQKVYGLRKCEVRLDPIPLLTLQQIVQPLPCNKEALPKRAVKYIRKTMSTKASEPSANDGFDFGTMANYFDLRRSNSKNQNPMQLVHEGQPKNWQPEPMTSIPFKNVISFMEDADVRTFFRKTLYGHLKRVETEFEKYVAKTDLRCLSLNNFWQEYYTAAPDIELPVDKIKIKLEKPLLVVAEETESINSIDFEAVYLSDCTNFESEIEVTSDPETSTALPNIYNNPKPSDVNCKNFTLKDDHRSVDVPQNINSKRPLPSGAAETNIAEKRRRLTTESTNNYLQEYCNFLDHESRCKSV